MGNLCSGYSRGSGSESCIIDPVSDTDFMGGGGIKALGKIKVPSHSDLSKQKSM